MKKAATKKPWNTSSKGDFEDKKRREDDPERMTFQVWLERQKDKKWDGVIKKLIRSLLVFGCAGGVS